MSDNWKGVIALVWCGLDIVAFCTAMFFFGGRK